MKHLIILVISIYLTCAGGCAWEHRIEITAPRYKPSPSGFQELTPTGAEQLFRKVAGQFKFEVSGPILQSANYGTITNYTAVSSAKNPMAPAYMVVYIYKAGTTFDIVADNFTQAQKMASPFEEALDKRNIQYFVGKITANALNY
jgi:hypothetical protein